MGTKKKDGLSDLIAEEVDHDHSAAEPLEAFPATEPLSSFSSDSGEEAATETRLMKNPLATATEAPAQALDQRKIAPLPKGVQAELVIEDSGEVFRISKSLTIIGRVREVADIVIADDKTSRHHAALTYEDEKFFIEDLDSTNGTFVDAKRIKRALLRAGVPLTIGRCTLKLRVS